MSKKRPKKKVSRKTNKPTPTETKANYVLRTGAVVLFLFERGLDVAGYTNLSLSWAIWGSAAALLWWSICRSEWPNHKVSRLVQNNRIRCTGLILIGLFFGMEVWYAPGHKPAEAAPTSAMVDDIVKKVGQKTTERLEEKLRAMLSEVRANEEDRLKKEYTLGYAMIAFSGDKKIVAPYTDKLDVDWDSLRIYKDNQSWIHVALTFIDNHHNRWNGFPVVLPAVPGAKANAIVFAGQWAAQVECLRADPVGLFVVVGFKDSPSTKK